MDNKKRNKKEKKMDVIHDKAIEKPVKEGQNTSMQNIMKFDDKQKYNSEIDSQLIVLAETPERAAKSLLVELSDILHLSVDRIDLRFKDKMSTPTGFLTKFQQYSNGIPIEGAEITVHSDINGVIRSISAQCIQDF